MILQYLSYAEKRALRKRLSRFQLLQHSQRQATKDTIAGLQLLLTVFGQDWQEKKKSVFDLGVHLLYPWIEFVFDIVNTGEGTNSVVFDFDQNYLIIVASKNGIDVLLTRLMQRLKRCGWKKDLSGANFNTINHFGWWRLVPSDGWLVTLWTVQSSVRQAHSDAGLSLSAYPCWWLSLWLW